MKNSCPSCLKNSNCKIDVRDGKCINYITDSISHAQHRLYRSILLPALTEALGETNNQYAHDFILKPEFIYRQTGKYYIEVKKYSEIPEKHKKTCRVIIEYSEGYEGIPKCSLVIGYIPSMGKFTKSETKEYIRFCEILLEEIGGNIPTEHNQEYTQLRQKVLK